MSLRRAALVLGASLLVSLSLSLAIEAAADDPDPPDIVGAVVWDDRPASTSELSSDASVLVEARVLSVDDGDPLLFGNGDGSDDDHSIPTQRIHFKAVDVLDGQIAEQFDVFKTGSDDFHLQGDPPYEAGQRYVLFLEPGIDGTYIPAAPDGRLPLIGNEADPIVPGAVSDDLDGLTPTEIAEEAN